MAATIIGSVALGGTALTLIGAVLHISRNAQHREWGDRMVAAGIALFIISLVMFIPPGVRPDGR